MPGGLEGVHIHNNCESDDLSQLAQSAEALSDTLKRIDDLSWANLGGGYYLGPEMDTSPLEQVVGRLRSDYDVKVFIEPGTALAQQAGFLVTEALDVFPNDRTDIVVLDTSTSHMPEVFEYQYTPAVSRPEVDEGNPTRLAGRTCLAGDIFGDYDFQDPVRIGDRIAIMDAGGLLTLARRSFQRNTDSQCLYPEKRRDFRPGFKLRLRRLRQQERSNANCCLLKDRYPSIQIGLIFASLQSGVARFLSKDENPSAFRRHQLRRRPIQCEIGVIVGEHPHSVSPLFASGVGPRRPRSDSMWYSWFRLESERR